MPASREAWLELTKSEEVKRAVTECRDLYKKGDRKAYDARKRSLPMVSYMCTFGPNEGGDPRNPKPTGTWRLQTAARLNGLVMHDYDKLSLKGIDVRTLYQALPTHWFDDNSCPTAILVAHVTPSGDGLRLVTIANPALDIEQNQQALCTQIRALADGKFSALEPDDSCINADRGSFMVDADSILFMNERVFDYDNREFDERFGQKYRAGRVTGSARKKPSPARVTEVTEGQTPCEVSYPDTYHNVEYASILDTWFEQNGGEPCPGDRHKLMLHLVGDLRYICSNSAPFLRHVLMKRQFIRDWVEKEGAGRELDDILTGSTSKELWFGTPKRLKAVLDTLGIASEATGSAATMDEEGEKRIYLNFWHRLEPLLTEPYILACAIVSDENKLAALLTAGAMYCTLMTRCTYEHYDGKMTRLNPSVFIIGRPASGKSFAERLDRQIMAVMRNADAPGRKAEKQYKKKQKERQTSSKAQKSDPLEQPDVMICK